MTKNGLGIVVSSAMGIPEARQLPLIAKIGFDSFFTVWSDDSPIAEYKRLADEYGLLYHSIHGPSDGKAFVTNMWSPGEEGKTATDEIIHCLEVCSENEVGMLVSHVHSGFEYELPDVTSRECAIENFGRLADRAAELGVKLALENIEGVEFLAVLLDAFCEHPAVGFCYDTGHERCYCGGRDLTLDFGEHLIATHIHDNFGASYPDGRIGSRDDMHMLPFDGIVDWQRIAERLDVLGYDGVMMLEVKRTVWYSDRHENDKYRQMTPEEYITEAYARGCRLAAMRNNK